VSADPGCVFCKIVAGDIPCLRLFEDDVSFSFLDVGPLAEGHLLLIPRSHYETLDQMPGEVVARLTQHLPRLAKAVARAVSCDGYNVLQNNGRIAGQAVAHVHFHIIPRVSGDSLGYRWPAGKYPEGRAELVQRAILDQLSNT
jgi:histidine triad (HIT) family protein